MFNLIIMTLKVLMKKENKDKLFIKILIQRLINYSRLNINHQLIDYSLIKVLIIKYQMVIK